MEKEEIPQIVSNQQPVVQEIIPNAQIQDNPYQAQASYLREESKKTE